MGYARHLRKKIQHHRCNYGRVSHIDSAFDHLVQRAAQLGGDGIGEVAIKV